MYYDHNKKSTFSTLNYGCSFAGFLPTLSNLRELRLCLFLFHFDIRQSHFIYLVLSPSFLRSVNLFFFPLYTEVRWLVWAREDRDAGTAIPNRGTSSEDWHTYGSKTSHPTGGERTHQKGREPQCLCGVKYLATLSSVVPVYIRVSSDVYICCWCFCIYLQGLEWMLKILHSVRCSWEVC